MHDAVIDLASKWLPFVRAARELNTIVERHHPAEVRHIVPGDDAGPTVGRAGGIAAELAAARKRYVPMIAPDGERWTCEDFARD